MKHGIGFILAVLLVGAIVGSLLGIVLGQLVPSGPLHRLLAEGATLGLSPATLDLLALRLTLGLVIRANLCTAIGILLAFVYLRRR